MTILLLLIIVCNVSANTIVVGKNKPVNTLRQGIKMAKDGDTILLNQGTYKEGNIIIDKAIHLIGVNAPVLDGDYKNEILTLTGKKIVIRGIHLANAGYSSMNDYAALKIIDATNILVENNTIINASFGIHIANSTNSIIRNNTIRGTNKSEHGIHLWKCSAMMIEGNAISGHRDGIYLEFVTESTIQKNRSEKNVRYGLHFMFSHNDTYLGNIFENNGAGVAVMYSKHVRMENNLFDKNWGPSAYGILLKDISNSHILHNKFTLPDIFLIDKQLSGTSGLDVCRFLKKQNSTRQIPVIMISASPDIGKLSQEAGADNFIEKPFNVKDLLSMINRYILPNEVKEA